MTGTSRDLGLQGAGKGSRPRNCGTKAFNQNYDDIKFFQILKLSDEAEGFTRRGNKLKKTYK